ncbi:MAG: RCC1 domain-containing protein, partial [Candidatus Aquicultor sp.]
MRELLNKFSLCDMQPKRLSYLLALFIIIVFFGTLTVASANEATQSVAPQIASGGYHALALASDGTVWGWGNNMYGQLGNGSTTTDTPIRTPVRVISITGVTAIAAGYCYSLALTSDGKVWAWGQNNYGQLGNSTTTNSSIPVQVSGLTGVI